MVTFLLIGRPLVLRLGGATEISPAVYRVTAGFTHKKKLKRREYVRARLEYTPDGTVRAQKHGASGAGVLSSLVGAKHENDGRDQKLIGYRVEKSAELRDLAPRAG